MKYATIKTYEKDASLVVVKKENLTKCEGRASVNGNECALEPRSTGEFKNRGFYLNSLFDWVLGKDDAGIIVLVPLKKEEK